MFTHPVINIVQLLGVQDEFWEADHVIDCICLTRSTQTNQSLTLFLVISLFLPLFLVLLILFTVKLLYYGIPGTLSSTKVA